MQDLLQYKSTPDPLSPVNSPIVLVTAFIAKFLPFSYQSIAFFLPVVLSSLIVFPVVLIGIKAGLHKYDAILAGLFASIFYPYFSRTVPGYFDTDMLVVVLPTIGIYFIIQALINHKNIYLYAVSFFLAFFQWWHHSGHLINIAFGIIYILYYLLFSKKTRYETVLLVFILVGISTLPFFLKFIILILLFVFQKYWESYFKQFIILSLLILSIFFLEESSNIFRRISAFLFNSDIRPIKLLYFYDSMSDVAELQNFTFQKFVRMFSGNIIAFTFSVVGYILLLLKFRYLVFSLPLVLLGLSSYIVQSGFRFSMFAMPFLSLGLIYSISVFFKMIQTATSNKKIILFTKYFFIVLLLLPNFQFIKYYQAEPEIYCQEIEILKKLKKIASSHDYIVNWWDKGYAIRYFSNLRTASDGGKMYGTHLFPISYALFSPFKASVTMSKINIDYINNNYVTDRVTHFTDIMKSYQYNDVHKFLKDIEEAKVKTNQNMNYNIYYYLNIDMLKKFATVIKYSNLNPVTGKNYKTPLYYLTNKYKDYKNSIDLGNDVILNKKNASIKYQNSTFLLKRFIKVSRNSNNSLNNNMLLFNPKGKISLVYIQEYDIFLLMDEKVYNSTFIQLFIFEKYDKKYFELVLSSPWAKIYRVNQ